MVIRHHLNSCLLIVMIAVILKSIGDSSMSKVMQLCVKKRIKMSPREAVIRNSSCDDNNNNDKKLQEES